MPGKDSFPRFAELARLVFAHCPAVTSIEIQNEYDHYRDDTYISESQFARFDASIPDTDLDLVPGVRRLEREASDLIMGSLDYRNEDGRQETVCLGAERNRLYAYVQGPEELCCKTLVWDRLDDVKRETGRPEVWISFLLPDEASGHESLSLFAITTLGALMDNKIVQQRLCYDSFSFEDFPGSTKVQVSIVGKGVDIAVSVPDDIDIFD